MNYLPEEVEFVRFCENQEWEVICTTRKGKRAKSCPASKSCDKNSPTCSQILTKMEGAKELTELDTKIIAFWYYDVDWDWDNCIPEGGREPCYNFGTPCCERWGACERLLQKLGVYEPDDYGIHEKEIQQVIVNDLRKSRIDWYTVERLEYYTQKPAVAVGQPDILCIGMDSKRLYVVELKVVEATRRDVGQLASYVGWYTDHPEDRPEPCKDKEVVGILLAPMFNTGAEYALRACTNLHKRCFDLHVEIIKPADQAV